MENICSKIITGFRNFHGAQQSMVAMLERWRKALDKKGIYLRLIYESIRDF